MAPMRGRNDGAHVNQQSRAGIAERIGDVVSDLVLFLPLLQLNFLDKYIVLAFLF